MKQSGIHRKRQSGIFRRVYLGHLTASFAVLAIMSVFFVFAIRSAITRWNKNETADIEQMLMPVISKVHRLDGGLDASTLESALLPYITDSLYVYVFDRDKHPVLLLNRGQRVSQKEVEKQVGSMQTFLALNSPSQIKDGDETVGYLSVDSVDFLAYRTNREFVSNIKKAVAAGAAGAVFIALCISAFISSSYSKQATSLVKEITDFSDGNRHIKFTHSATTEFDMLVRSEEKLQKQLWKEEALRRQWMQDISHDLRTPVTAVKVQLEAMGDGVLDCSTARLENLLGEIVNIEKLVNNLHELIRYESPEMVIRPVCIDPGVFISDIQERFGFLAEQKRLRYHCTSSVTGFFAADEFLLQRCVSNIVQNALQYTAPGGRILVTLERTGGRRADGRQNIRIEVRNTGSLTPKDKEHVFDRLYRGDSSRREGGTGLGLSIAKAIMDLHHGSISAENRDGNVCLCMEFPFQPVPEETAGTE